jgi:hypothetical protein
MRTNIINELAALLGEEQTEAAGGNEDVIVQHLALAAQVVGVDLSDEEQLKSFMSDVRNVITKDAAKLRSQLRRWTSGKARTAVKTAKAAV